MEKVIAAALLLILISSARLQAAEADHCYLIPVENPEMSRDAKPRAEAWCYRFTPGIKGGTYIFNADQQKVRPELVLLVDADGMITHSSLSAGKLSVHRVNSSLFNPFSIPLKEPRNLKRVAPAPLEQSSLDEVFQRLLSFNEKEHSSEMSVLESPTFASAYQPWRGYWWPYRGRPLQRGPYSRFDRFVSVVTGHNPGAVAWEDTYHSYHGIWWEGHCNGWAAASVLRAEPLRARFDARSGVKFSVSDQKALYTGVDYCVNSAFFGERYRGPGNNPRDIFPHVFHKVLSYYIGALHKPVAIDYHADVPVDNHVISSYRFDMRRVGENTYNVIANLTMHRYDGAIVDIPGIAPRYTKIYKYLLITDNAGVPIGGSWLSENPDFLWVPLSSRSCNSNNQNLELEWVNAIMALPQI